VAASLTTQTLVILVVFGASSVPILLMILSNIVHKSACDLLVEFLWVFVLNLAFSIVVVDCCG
jgi:hypothetical protein